MALGTQSPIALSSRGQASQLAVLVDGLAKPVDASILRELRILNPHPDIQMMINHSIEPSF